MTEVLHARDVPERDGSTTPASIARLVPHGHRPVSLVLPPEVQVRGRRVDIHLVGWSWVEEEEGSGLDGASSGRYLLGIDSAYWHEGVALNLKVLCKTTAVYITRFVRGWVHVFDFQIISVEPLT